MKGKIVPLRPCLSAEKQKAGMANRAKGFLTVPMQEVERLLWRAAARVPGELRNRIIAIAEKGERLCPALFLIIVLSQRADSRHDSRHIYRFAASLEALHLALKTHWDITTGTLLKKEAILCGDFYFGQALTLAGNKPLFVQGMSEVITRFGVSSLDLPGRSAVLKGEFKSYLQKICDSMASIYALSCTLGAWQAGLKAWQNEALSYYGLYLGIGLQIKRETEAFEACFNEKQLFVRVSLPVFYILRESPLRHKLASLLDKRLSQKEGDLFLQEAERTNSRSYLDQVINNCYSKANHFVELLRDSVDQKTLALLKEFLS